MKNKFKILILSILLIALASNLLHASGTEAGSRIIAVSTNIEVIFTDSEGAAASKDASTDGIPDNIQTLLEINGLVQTATDVSALGSPVSGVYKNIKGGTSGTVRPYLLTFTYMNRGNTSEDIKISSNVTGGPRWITQDDVRKHVIEDDIGTLRVTLNVQNPISLEDISLRVIGSLVTASNVVSYNAWTGAVGIIEGGFEANVPYGGLNNITNNYTLEAEGASLVFPDKTLAISAPPDYEGSATAPVPGAKLRYTTTIKNTSTVVAINVDFRDQVPNDCHLYYEDTPEISGTADTNYSWYGAQNNSAGSGSTFGWDDIRISPNATVTLKYSVTID